MRLRLSVGTVFGNPFLRRKALVWLKIDENYVFRYGVGASLWFL